MSIATQINRINTAKSNIRTAIIGKGVSVPAAAKIDTYASYVTQIPQGGGGGDIPMPQTLKSLTLDAYGRPTSIVFNGSEVGQEAYYSTRTLTSVTLTDDVAAVDNDAFAACENLSALTIGNNVVQIYDGAFSSCGLTGVTFGNRLYGINYAFNDCFKLTSVTLPASIRDIDGAFINCQNLQTVILQNGIEGIGTAAFKDCYSLTTINFPDTVSEIGNGAFENCRNLQAVSFGNRLETIGNGAFKNCLSLTSIVIQSGVTSVGYQAFMSSSNLQSITFKGTTPPEFGYEVFNDTYCPIFVPCSSINAYKNALEQYADRIYGDPECCTYKTDTIEGAYVCEDGYKYSISKKYESYDGGVTWHDSYPSIVKTQVGISPDCAENYLYTYTEYGQDYTEPCGETQIGESALSGIEMTDAQIGNCCNKIDNYAFYNCQSLSSITLSNAVETIGHETFMECTSLTSITIPSSISELGFWCFPNELQELIFESPEPPYINRYGNEGFGWFDTPATVSAVYVPDDAVETYRSLPTSTWIGGWDEGQWNPNIIQGISNRS